jgi:hypothetical protein
LRVSPIGPRIISDDALDFPQSLECRHGPPLEPDLLASAESLIRPQS